MFVTALTFIPGRSFCMHVWIIDIGWRFQKVVKFILPSIYLVARLSISAVDMLQVVT
jgi:hypothetical protein